MSRSSLSLDAARRLPGASLLLVAFAVAASALPGVAVWLQFDRSAIAGGAVWRLVTSHFVHWSGEHLFWDVLALAVLGWLCERQDRERFLKCVGLAAVLIPLFLWMLEPWMMTYRGLSGIDSALFAMLAAVMLREAVVEHDWSRLGFVATISLGFAAKVGFEIVSGATLFVDSSAAGMRPVPLAHVVGALVGLFCGLFVRPIHATTPPFA